MKRVNMLTMMAIAVAFISFIAMSGTVYAQTLSFTHFEDFITGTSVDGQGGWGSMATWDEEVVDDGTGNNVWRVSNAFTALTFYNMPFAPRPGGIPTDSVNNPVNGAPLFFAGESSTNAAHNRFIGQFSFRSATGAPQPGLRITISADNGWGARHGFIAISETGSGIDIASSNIDPDTGRFTSPIIIASNLSYTDWHTVEIQVNFCDGPSNDTVNYFVNGNLVQVGTSYEEFYRNFQAELHPLNVPSQTLIFRLSGDSAPLVEGDGFYIDNVSTSIATEAEIANNCTELVLNPVFPALDDNINFITAENATPFGNIGFLWGKSVGSFVFGGRTCNGLEIGIKNPNLLAIEPANEFGIATHIFYIPTFSDLEFLVQLQAVDVESCSVSNVVPQIIRKD